LYSSPLYNFGPEECSLARKQNWKEDAKILITHPL